MFYGSSFLFFPLQYQFLGEVLRSRIEEPQQKKTVHLGYRSTRRSPKSTLWAEKAIEFLKVRSARKKMAQLYRLRHISLYATQDSPLRGPVGTNYLGQTALPLIISTHVFCMYRGIFRCIRQ